LSFGDHFVEYGIPLLCHSRPVNIKVWSDWLPLILDHFDIPISLKVVPKMVIMEVGGPNIRILIPLNHGMILLPHEIGGLARMATVHSSEGVQEVGLEQRDHFLDGITRFFFFLLSSRLT
jgi:hypothetical protein